MSILATPRDDAVLFDTVLRIAREECVHGDWNDIEPALAASWERLRSPMSPRWEQICEHVRASCREQGLLH